MINFYHINAFVNEKSFSGNPAGVYILKELLDDEIMQKIAQEHNLPATVFVNIAQSPYEIRWFTPDYELDLCGHGSLGAAYILFNCLKLEKKELLLKSRTELIAVNKSNHLIALEFPAKIFSKIDLDLEDMFDKTPIEIYAGVDRLFIIFQSEEHIREVKINFEALKKLNYRGITISAASEKVDFVSRTFYPNSTIIEDPVTGSTHCYLIPYWSQKLGKKKLVAEQLSKREGRLEVEMKEKVVMLSGNVSVYMQGVSINFR